MRQVIQEAAQLIVPDTLSILVVVPEYVIRCRILKRVGALRPLINCACLEYLLDLEVADG